MVTTTHDPDGLRVVSRPASSTHLGRAPLRSCGLDPRTPADWFSALTDTPHPRIALQLQAPRLDPTREAPNLPQHYPRAIT